MDPLDAETPAPNPMKWILVAALVIIFIGVALLGVTKEAREARRNAVSQEEQALSSAHAALNAQQQKVVELTNLLETLKQSPEEYTRVAQEQRAAREVYLKLREDYNQKATAHQQKQP